MLRSLIVAAAVTAVLTSPLSAQSPHARTFVTPQQAADALIDAVDRYDVAALEALFGPGTKDVLLSGEEAQNRERAHDFVAQARQKKDVSIDPKNARRAFVVVGDGSWPFPIPLVKRATTWSFDLAAGRQELLYRRVGSNELDAIAICRGYVEAQHAYALKAHDGQTLNQYAQRIISTPGKQDGLAWQRADGTWEGPVGERIAKVIAEGYKQKEPYHGYFFKVLTGQGPAAPLGEMDFVVKGVMIGGFALAAAPAEYGVTGVKTFIVSHDGVVYQKDFGAETTSQFAKMERFNPDRSWTPVSEN